LSGEKVVQHALRAVGHHVEVLKVIAKHQLAYYIAERFTADPIIQSLGAIYAIACRQSESIERILGLSSNKNKVAEMTILAESLRQTEKLADELAASGISLRLN